MNHPITALLLFFVFYVTPPVLQAQEKILSVPYQSQETGSWCWAACMKMIINFHQGEENNITQCDLVKSRIKFENPNVDVNAISCCKNCSKGCDSTFNTCNRGLDNYTIPFSEAYAAAQPDYYDLIFFDLGFNSTQQINKMEKPFSWERLVHEIDSSRPFIININSKQDGEIIGNHALVVKGYKIKDGEKYIIVNDPWRPCCNEVKEYMLSYRIFLGEKQDTPNGYAINSILSVVHSIDVETKFINNNNCKKRIQLFRKKRA